MLEICGRWGIARIFLYTKDDKIEYIGILLYITIQCTCTDRWYDNQVAFYYLPLLEKVLEETVFLGSEALDDFLKGVPVLGVNNFLRQDNRQKEGNGCCHTQQPSAVYLDDEVA